MGNVIVSLFLVSSGWGTGQAMKGRGHLGSLPSHGGTHLSGSSDSFCLREPLCKQYCPWRLPSWFQRPPSRAGAPKASLLLPRKPSPKAPGLKCAGQRRCLGDLWAFSNLVLLPLLLVIKLTFTGMGPKTGWKEKRFSGSRQVLELPWSHVAGKD